MKLFSSPKWFSDNKNAEDKQHDDSLLAKKDTTIADSCEIRADSSQGNAICAKTPLAVLAQTLGYSVSDNANSIFMHASVPNEDESNFLNTLTLKAESLIIELKSLECASSDENAAESQTLCLDMSLEIFISQDQMKAYGFIFPPFGGGKSLDYDKLKALVNKEGVYFGIDEELLQKIINEDLVFKVFTIAEGKPVIDGTDGQIIDMFKREKHISFTVDDHETVDYKNLNWLQRVHEGEVICKIIPPTAAEDGMNVRGIAIKSQEGKIPKVPMGKNTIENEDHTALVAAVDGQLTFSNSLFKVEQLLQIDEDVDGTIGNIDMIGSVNVKGNVFDGFEIKATGDILVHGSVMGALLSAGGNIKVVGGMNGSYKGKLEAGGTVSSKYLENCYVSARGTVKTDCIINSTIISSDKVIVVSGRGAILGSTVTSFKGVEAKVIGNERNLPTKINVGSDPKLSEEMRTLKKEVHDLTRKTEEYDKNIQYLLKAETLDDVHQQLLKQLKLDYTIMNMNISKKTNRMKALEEELKDDSYHIVANEIFPPLSVTIGTISQQFFSGSKMSRIYKHEGEIILGSK